MNSFHPSGREKKSLIVTAHPDDESLFFGGLVLSQKQTVFDNLCLTSGGSEHRCRERSEELEKACQQLGFRQVFHGCLEDHFQSRLSQSSIKSVLTSLMEKESYDEIYTHGILGEYGHPHHQDVSGAVHHCITDRPVWSVAFNTPADFHVNLNHSQFEKKARVLTEVYELESRRFYNLLPISHTEGFSQVARTEVQALYDFLTQGSPLDESCIVYHRAILPLLRSNPLSQLADYFFKAYFQNG